MERGQISVRRARFPVVTNDINIFLDRYTEHIPKESRCELRAQAVAQLLEVARARNDTLAVGWLDKERGVMLDGIQNLVRPVEVSWVAELISSTIAPGHFLTSHRRLGQINRDHYLANTRCIR